MRYTTATRGTAWTQPDLMDGLQLFVAVSLCWTLRLSLSHPHSVMTWGPDFMSLLWPHSCTSLLVGFRGSTELTIFQSKRISESGAWLPACWLNPLKAHATSLIPHSAWRSIIGPPGSMTSRTDRGLCMGGKTMTRKLPLHLLPLIWTSLEYLCILAWNFPNQFVLSD